MAFRPEHFGERGIAHGKTKSNHQSLLTFYVSTLNLANDYKLLVSKGLIKVYLHFRCAATHQCVAAASNARAGLYAFCRAASFCELALWALRRSLPRTQCGNPDTTHKARSKLAVTDYSRHIAVKTMLGLQMYAKGNAICPFCLRRRKMLHFITLISILRRVR